MGNTSRVFAALWLPPAARSAVARLQERTEAEAPRRVKWVNSDNLHLTIRFIGEVNDAKIPTLVESIATVPRIAISSGFTGTGFFLLKHRSTILWLGVKNTDALQSVKRSTDNALAKVHVIPDKRRFVPHVTVGKTVGALKAIPSLTRIWQQALPTELSFTFAALKLFKTIYLESGIMYEAIAARDL